MEDINIKRDKIINISANDMINLSYINSGSFADVFEYSETECVKIWNKYLKASEDIDKFFKFTNLDVGCATFPKKLVFLGDEFKGFTMNYINGYSFAECEEFNFSFFLNRFLMLINEIQDHLSNNRIVIDDIHENNIMWDINNNIFVLIDIDNWIFSRDYVDVIRNKNFGQMTDFFSCFIFDNGNFNYFYDAFIWTIILIL